MTDRRVILVMTRAGAFGPLLENTGTQTFDRDQIVRYKVGVGETLLSFEMRNGNSVTLNFQRSKQFGNVDAFWRDVPRILDEWKVSRAS